MQTVDYCLFSKTDFWLVKHMVLNMIFCKAFFIFLEDHKDIEKITALFDWTKEDPSIPAPCIT